MGAAERGERRAPIAIEGGDERGGTKTSVASFAMEGEIFDLGEGRKKEEHLSMRRHGPTDQLIGLVAAFLPLTSDFPLMRHKSRSRASDSQVMR